MNYFWKAITLGLLTSLLGIAVSFTHYGLDLEENFGLASLFKLRGERQAPPAVVVISLDKESADRLNLPQDVRRWPRSHHAHLIQKLIDESASVIVFDLNFKYEGEGDGLLAKAIRKAGNVVLAEHIVMETITPTNPPGNATAQLTVEKVLPPIPALAQEAVASAPFVLPKVPVRVNQFWTFTGDSGEFPTIPVVTFQIFALQVYDDLVDLIRKALNHPEIGQAKLDRENRSALAIAQRLTDLKGQGITANRKVHELISSLKELLGKQTLISEMIVEELENSEQSYPDTQSDNILKALIKMYQNDNSYYLNFYGPPHTITTVPYWRVLQPSGKIEAKSKSVDFKDRVVFIGSSETSTYDQMDGFYTVFSQPNGIDLSGVEICATAFANLLEDLPVRPLDFPAHLLTLFIWGITIGMIAFLLPPVLATVSSVALVLVYAGIAYYQFESTSTWFPLIIPIFLQMPFASFGAVLWKYFDTNRERMVIRKAFGHYVPNEVVDRLSKSLGNLRADGQSVYGTCLYTDIENFTTLSETMPPEELRGLMNDYYEAVFSPVNQHGGGRLGF